MLVPCASSRLKVHLMVYRKIVFIFRYKNEINLRNKSKTRCRGESLFRLLVVGGNGNKTPFILGNLNDKNCNTYHTFICTDSFDSVGNCLPVSFRRL